MSRKIDALVAEYVMGEDISFYVAGDEWTEAKYSSSIAAAWQVVEKLVDEASPAEMAVVKITPGHEDSPRDYVCVYNDPFNINIREYADTPAMAICLAALKAKGVEVD